MTEFPRFQPPEVVHAHMGKHFSNAPSYLHADIPGVLDETHILAHWHNIAQLLPKGDPYIRAAIKLSEVISRTVSADTSPHREEHSFADRLRIPKQAHQLSRVALESPVVLYAVGEQIWREDNTKKPTPGWVGKLVTVAPVYNDRSRHLSIEPVIESKDGTVGLFNPGVYFTGLFGVQEVDSITKKWLMDREDLISEEERALAIAEAYAISDEEYLKMAELTVRDGMLVRSTQVSTKIE